MVDVPETQPPGLCPISCDLWATCASPGPRRTGSASTSAWLRCPHACVPGRLTLTSPLPGDEADRTIDTTAKEAPQIRARPHRHPPAGTQGSARGQDTVNTKARQEARLPCQSRSPVPGTTRRSWVPAGGTFT